MKTLKVPNGIVHLAESKAHCPHCTRYISINEIDEDWINSSEPYLRHRCKGCKRHIEITQTIKGDFIAYEI